MTKAEQLGHEEKLIAEKRPAREARASLEELARSQRRIATLERKIGQQQVELDFFSASIAASQGIAPAERRAWLDGIYEVIQTMTASPSQGEIGARQPRQGALIHHSHRGVQYTEILAAHDIQPSMSRVGNPYDNAKADALARLLLLRSGLEANDRVIIDGLVRAIPGSKVTPQDGSWLAQAVLGGLSKGATRVTLPADRKRVLPQ